MRSFTRNLLKFVSDKLKPEMKKYPTANFALSDSRGGLYRSSKFRSRLRLCRAALSDLVLPPEEKARRTRRLFAPANPLAREPYSASLVQCSQTITIAPCPVRSIGARDDAIAPLILHCDAKRRRAFPGRPASRPLPRLHLFCFFVFIGCQRATR